MQRKPWTIISGGPAAEGGVYKSIDGGDHWTQRRQRISRRPDREGRVRRRAVEPEARLRAGGSQGQGWPVPLGRWRRDVDAGERQPVA